MQLRLECLDRFKSPDLKSGCHLHVFLLPNDSLVSDFNEHAPPPAECQIAIDTGSAISRESFRHAVLEEGLLLRCDILNRICRHLGGSRSTKLKRQELSAA